MTLESALADLRATRAAIRDTRNQCQCVGCTEFRFTAWSDAVVAYRDARMVDLEYTLRLYATRPARPGGQLAFLAMRAAP